MIDLTQTKKTNVYPIKLVDGTVLHIKAPTQAMLTSIISLKEEAENIDEAQTMETIGELYNILTMIFNHNYDNKEFTQDGIESDIDINTCITILEDYLNETLNKLGK